MKFPDLDSALCNDQRFAILAAHPVLTVYHASTRRPPVAAMQPMKQAYRTNRRRTAAERYILPRITLSFTPRFDPTGFVLHDSSVLLLLPLLLSLGNALGSGARVFHNSQRVRTARSYGQSLKALNSGEHH